MMFVFHLSTIGERSAVPSAGSGRLFLAAKRPSFGVER